MSEGDRTEVQLLRDELAAFEEHMRPAIQAWEDEENAIQRREEDPWGLDELQSIGHSDVEEDDAGEGDDYEYDDRQRIWDEAQLLDFDEAMEVDGSSEEHDDFIADDVFEDYNDFVADDRQPFGDGPSTAHENDDNERNDNVEAQDHRDVQW
ncbi:MAG: hypothetical protein M1812_002063 [Candelaria pacifica]|nr:MAG: hypothetical protein M1812_002063 [Candelaria pacifica]